MVEDDDNDGVADAIAARLIATLGHGAEGNDIQALYELFGDQSDRYGLARTLIDLMVPSMIDVDLWRRLALGQNIDLPASDQYGPVADRLRPPERRGPAGNIYGKVHAKGDQAPSAFLKRQGEAIAANTRRIEEAERKLAELRERGAALDHGMRAYATTALLTAMKKATAPVFAMGPAWTLLEAIQGPATDEPDQADRARDTQRILVVLHALRADAAFRARLKSAILAVCHRYAGEAARSRSNPFDGPFNFEDVLANLGWPDTPDPDRPWR